MKSDTIRTFSLSEISSSFDIFATYLRIVNEIDFMCAFGEVNVDDEKNVRGDRIRE